MKKYNLVYRHLGLCTEKREQISSHSFALGNNSKN